MYSSHENRHRRDKKLKVKKERQDELKKESPAIPEVEVSTEKDLTYYIRDRVQLMREVFDILKDRELIAMAPSCLRGIKVDDLQELCLEEVLGISSKRLTSILDGYACPSDTDSSSQEEEELLETISLDSISSMEDYADTHHGKKSKKKSKAGKKGKKSKQAAAESSGAPAVGGSRKKKDAVGAAAVSSTGMTVLELLELQARARAIRAQLEAQGKPDVSDNEETEDIKELSTLITKHSESEDDDDDDVVIKEEPPEVVEIQSSSNEEADKVDQAKKNKKSKEKNKKSKDKPNKKTTEVPENVAEPKASSSNSIDKNSNAKPSNNVQTAPTLQVIMPAATNSVQPRKIKLNRTKIVVSVNNSAANQETSKPANHDVVIDLDKHTNEKEAEKETVEEKNDDKSAKDHNVNSVVKKVKKRKKSEKVKKRRGSDEDEIMLQLSDSEKMDLLEGCETSSSSEDSSSEESEEEVVVVQDLREKIKRIHNKKAQSEESNKEKSNVEVAVEKESDENKRQDSSTEMVSIQIDDDVEEVNDSKNEESEKVNSECEDGNESTKENIEKDAGEANCNENSECETSKIDVDTEEDKNVSSQSDGEKEKVNEDEGEKSKDQSESGNVRQENVQESNTSIDTEKNDDENNEKDVENLEETSHQNVTGRNENVEDEIKSDKSTKKKNSEQQNDGKVKEKKRRTSKRHAKKKKEEPSSDSEDSEEEKSKKKKASRGKKKLQNKPRDLEKFQQKNNSTEPANEATVSDLAVENVVEKDSIMISYENTDKNVEINDKNEKEEPEYELSEGECSYSSDGIEITESKPEVVCISDDASSSDDAARKCVREKGEKRRYRKQSKGSDGERDKIEVESQLNQDSNSENDENIEESARIVIEPKSVEVDDKECEKTVEPESVDLEEEHVDDKKVVDDVNESKDDGGNESDYFEVFEISDSSSDEQNSYQLSKEPTTQEIEELSRKIDTEIEREDIVFDDKELDEMNKSTINNKDDEINESEDASWKERWLESDKVKKVLATSSLCNAIRKKNKELKKKLAQTDSNIATLNVKLKETNGSKDECVKIDCNVTDLEGNPLVVVASCDQDVNIQLQSSVSTPKVTEIVPQSTEINMESATPLENVIQNVESNKTEVGASVDEGSIEHYNTLTGSNKYVDPVVNVDLGRGLNIAMAKDAKQLMKMYKKLVKIQRKQEEDGEGKKKKKDKKEKKKKKSKKKDEERPESSELEIKTKENT